MAGDSNRQLDWTTVVAVGGVIAGGGGVPLLIAASPGGKMEFYALVLLVGGLVVVLLGFILALWRQGEWKRPPSLPWGFSCSHYPVRSDSKRFPEYPHAQELAIGLLRRRIYPPDIRIICTAPIGKVEALLHSISPTPTDPREAGFHHTSIDAVSILFSPLEPVEPPALINLIVFSSEPIRVRKIKLLKTKYQPTQPPEDPP